jgi:hypothetical protein
MEATLDVLFQSAGWASRERLLLPLLPGAQAAQ